MLRDAADDDIVAFADIPVAHRKKIWTTNPLGRANKTPTRHPRRRRLLPNPEILRHLAGYIRVQIHGEWQIAVRRHLSEPSIALIDNNTSQEV